MGCLGKLVKGRAFRPGQNRKQIRVTAKSAEDLEKEAQMFKIRPKT